MKQAPVVGLPAKLNGKPLAWAKGKLDEGQCACCGEHGERPEIILCGRCACLLSDVFPSPERKLTEAEEQRENRRVFRQHKKHRRK